MHHASASAAVFAEAASVLVVLGHFFAGLPSIATLLAVVWYALNIYDRLRRKEDK